MLSKMQGRLIGIFTVINMVMVLALSANAQAPVTHFVSAGGPDICAAFGLSPGCDKNYSLVAMERNGVVSGKLTDRFASEFGGGGFQADIDCLFVSGNEAWFGGFITQGQNGDGEDITGLYVLGRVRDNGKSANDPPDEISPSFSFGFDPFPCEEQLDFLMGEAPQGQVNVR